MQLTNTKLLHTTSKVSLVPAAFILGVFLLVVALLLQIATYVHGAGVMAGGVALALTINADASLL